MVTISLSFHFLLYQMIIDDGRFYWWKCISFEIRLIEFPFALIHLPPSLCILFLAWIRYQLTLKIHLHHHFLFHCWYQSSSACRSNQFILKIFFSVDFGKCLSYIYRTKSPQLSLNFWWYWNWIYLNKHNIMKDGLFIE